MEKAELSLLRRALPPGKQLRVVAAVVLAAVAVLVIGWALRARAGEPVRYSLTPGASRTTFSRARGAPAGG